MSLPHLTISQSLSAYIDDLTLSRSISTAKTYKNALNSFSAVLEDNNIDSVVLNKQDSSYHFGELELYVKAEDVVKAKRIISAHEEFWKHLSPDQFQAPYIP